MEESSLNHAIWEGDFDKVRAIVENGVDLDVLGSNGHTPLMQSAEMEDLEITKYLIQAGAKINFPGHEGATPLHIAVDISIDGIIQNGGSPGDEPLEMINFLLSKGADKDLKNSKGESALNWAESYSSNKVVSALNHGHS
jgi:ankyrin repeat protein